MRDKGPKEGSQNKGKGRVDKRQMGMIKEKKMATVTINVSINAYFSLFLS